MSIELDKDYNGSTQVKKWWEIVRDNFDILEKFSNETRTIADAATTPDQAEKLLADLIDVTPEYKATLETFKNAFHDPSVGTDVVTAMNTIANNYTVKKEGKSGNIINFDHNNVGNVAVGYLKNHTFPNGQKSGFVISNYDTDTNKTHLMFVDWSDGRIFIKDDLNGPWFDVFEIYDQMKANYEQVHLKIGNTNKPSRVYHYNDVSSSTAASSPNLPFVSWSYVSINPMLAHQFIKIDATKVLFKAINEQQSTSRHIYVELPNGVKLDFKESDWTQEGDRYYITIPSQEILITDNTVAMYIRPSENTVTGSSVRTYAHANNFEVPDGTVTVKEVVLEVH